MNSPEDAVLDMELPEFDFKYDSDLHLPNLGDLGSFDSSSETYELRDYKTETCELQDYKTENFNQYPVAPFGPPALGDFKGEYNFEIFLNSASTDKKKCIYSNLLNRVFLCMMSEMAVQFQWDWDASQHQELFVRATLVLSSKEQQEFRLTRCHNHRVPSDASNRDVPEFMLQHILRSARQDLTEVRYCGSQDDDREWLSVVFRAPQRPPQGSLYHQHVYRFCCKHSCVNAINRRRIEVLFTLEDSSGKIYGRKSLGVRVCSCPRRDMDKEEVEHRIVCGNEPPRKKLKTSAVQSPDNKEVHKQNVSDLVDGAHSILKVLVTHLPPGAAASTSVRKCLLELEAIKAQRNQSQ